LTADNYRLYTKYNFNLHTSFSTASVSNEPYIQTHICVCRVV